ncbi:hypothetical protein RJT34_09319 [Clitoria ternatea]|uniref:U5 small nuclear ribonucleoprotein TSSC4 n=1 Tax=Clitoria ternatea TaxID=43366 RepID=A0AAN9PT86_CLITE
MEDSFRVRAERAFGSLPIPSSPSSLSSLWSLTEDEFHQTPSNRLHRSKPEPEPQPYPSSSSGFHVELEKDLEDLDDDEAPRGPSRPPDYDDEQWQIRSGIGLDCTLDYEEEEDQYDKQAIGKEKSGDRVYMKDINDDGIEISSCGVFPTSFRDFVRDPRANHLAAKIRLKQDDDEAAKKIDALHVSEKSSPDFEGDTVNPKSILKSKDNPSEPRPLKRVRFDSECDDRGNGDDDNDEHDGTRDVRMRTSSVDDVAASDQPSKLQEFDSAVPDYLRNPSRYTCYSFDSSSDMDEKANKEAYMSFLTQLRAAKGAGSQDGALDDLPSVTFISKKKASDATMRDGEMVSKQKPEVGKEAMNRRAFPVGIAAGDAKNSDVCAMEEDEPEVIEDAKKSSQKVNRHYRKKTQEDPIV